MENYDFANWELSTFEIAVTSTIVHWELKTALNLLIQRQPFGESEIGSCKACACVGLN